VFDGGKILDRFGRNVWEDRCYALGITIQSGASVGVGAKRFRSVSRKNCVRSELWHDWIQKFNSIFHQYQNRNSKNNNKSSFQLNSTCATTKILALVPSLIRLKTTLLSNATTSA
jgi:hypothetical protein